MLTYLVRTSEQLAMAVVILGLLSAYTKKLLDKTGVLIVRIGALVGLVGSIVMSIMKNATSLIYTGYWNLGIFSVTLIFMILFFVFSVHKISDKNNKVCILVRDISVSGLIAMTIFYAFPDAWAYPYTFYSASKSVFSTDYLYYLIGYLAGMVLMLVLGLAVREGALRMNGFSASIILKSVLVINAIRQITVGLQVLLSKRMIKSNHTLFEIVKYSSNYSDVFIFITLIIAVVIPLVLWIASFRQQDPYRNPAEHRKIRAKWRKTRRWATVAAICMIASALNISVIKAIDSAEVELSPVEEAQIIDNNMVVEFEKVNDGHLHRFAYTTDDGVAVRFIVIQKPGGNTYGVGLDACDICGETGYYEKDDQVVCNLCDVVMNINTIGFKGGCNPIVIDYEIKDQKIWVPIQGLIDNADIFTR